MNVDDKSIPTPSNISNVAKSNSIDTFCQQWSNYVKKWDAILRDQLLKYLQELDPTDVEALTTYLLDKMGYARNGQAITTKKVNDNGIDCILYNHDSLKLQNMKLLVQVKRYSGVVARPDIDKFIGAISRQKPCHALFVTTGNFSKKAIMAAKQEKIQLINGKQFSSLLLKNKIFNNIEALKAYIAKTLRKTKRTINIKSKQVSKPKPVKPKLPPRKKIMHKKKTPLSKVDEKRTMQIRTDLCQADDNLNAVYSNKPRIVKVILDQARRLERKETYTVNMAITAENTVKEMNQLTNKQKQWIQQHDTLQSFIHNIVKKLKSKFIINGFLYPLYQNYAKQINASKKDQEMGKRIFIRKMRNDPWIKNNFIYKRARLQNRWNPIDGQTFDKLALSVSYAKKFDKKGKTIEISNQQDPYHQYINNMTTEWGFLRRFN